MSVEEVFDDDLQARMSGIFTTRLTRGSLHRSVTAALVLAQFPTHVQKILQKTCCARILKAGDVIAIEGEAVSHGIVIVTGTCSMHVRAAGAFTHDAADGLTTGGSRTGRRQLSLVCRTALHHAHDHGGALSSRPGTGAPGTPLGGSFSGTLDTARSLRSLALANTLAAAGDPTARSDTSAEEREPVLNLLAESTARTGSAVLREGGGSSERDGSGGGGLRGGAGGALVDAVLERAGWAYGKEVARLFADSNYGQDLIRGGRPYDGTIIALGRVKLLLYPAEVYNTMVRLVAPFVPLPDPDTHRMLCRPPVGRTAADISAISAVVQRHDFFRALPVADLRRFASVLKRRSLPDRWCVFKQSKPVDAGALYLVLSGSLSVHINPSGVPVDEDDDDECNIFIGDEDLLDTYGPSLTTLHSGDGFGERALVSNEPRGCTVIAREPTVLLALERADFERCMLQSEAHQRLVRDGTFTKLLKALQVPAASREEAGINFIKDNVCHHSMLTKVLQRAPRLLFELCRGAKYVRVETGAKMTCQGVAPEDFCLILAGLVSLHKLDMESALDAGQPPEVAAGFLGPCYAMLGAGQWFGEEAIEDLAAGDGRARPVAAATVVAQTACIFLWLRRADVKDAAKRAEKADLGEKVLTLAGSDALKDWSKESLEALGKQLEPKTFSQFHVLAQKGDIASKVYFVRQGMLTRSQSAGSRNHRGEGITEETSALLADRGATAGAEGVDDGPPSLTGPDGRSTSGDKSRWAKSLLGTGTLLGDTEALLRIPFSATIRAVTAVDVWAVDAAEFARIAPPAAVERARKATDEIMSALAKPRLKHSASEIGPSKRVGGEPPPPRKPLPAIKDAPVKDWKRESVSRFKYWAAESAVLRGSGDGGTTPTAQQSRERRASALSGDPPAGAGLPALMETADGGGTSVVGDAAAAAAPPPPVIASEAMPTVMDANGAVAPSLAPAVEAKPTAAPRKMVLKPKPPESAAPSDDKRSLLGAASLTPESIAAAADAQAVATMAAVAAGAMTSAAVMNRLTSQGPSPAAAAVASAPPGGAFRVVLAAPVAPTAPVVLAAATAKTTKREEGTAAAPMDVVAKPAAGSATAAVKAAAAASGERSGMDRPTGPMALPPLPSPSLSPASSFKSQASARSGPLLVKGTTGAAAAAAVAASVKAAASKASADATAPALGALKRTTSMAPPKKPNMMGGASFAVAKPPAGAVLARTSSKAAVTKTAGGSTPTLPPLDRK